MKQQDTYEKPKTLAFDNTVVRVHRPVLTKEERSARMKRIYNSAASLMKAVPT